MRGLEGPRTPISLEKRRSEGRAAGWHGSRKGDLPSRAGRSGRALGLVELAPRCVLERPEGRSDSRKVENDAPLKEGCCCPWCSAC